MVLHCILDFIFLLKSVLKSYQYKKPRDETLQMLRSKYQYLKVLIINEISMIGRETFGHFDLALKAIMKSLSPFGGVSLLVVGDFLQLPAFNQKNVLMKPIKRSCGLFNRWLWKTFQLHAVIEIVWQSRDPNFTQLLKRVREGQQTDNGVIQIKALAKTDTVTWLDEFVKVYLDNYLAGQENEYCIGKLYSEVAVIKARDGNKNIKTNRCSISIPDNMVSLKLPTYQQN